jgi:hypothetical protein
MLDFYVETKGFANITWAANPIVFPWKRIDASWERIVCGHCAVENHERAP